MRLVSRESSFQVLTESGHLIVSYPTESEARAFLVGYKTGVKDSAEKLMFRTREMLNEMKGSVA